MTKIDWKRCEFGNHHAFVGEVSLWCRKCSWPSSKWYVTVNFHAMSKTACSKETFDSLEEAKESSLRLAKNTLKEIQRSVNEHLAFLDSHEN